MYNIYKMTTRIINLIVPYDYENPELLSSLSADEQALILTIGCDMINRTRNLAIERNDDTIYNDMIEEHTKAISKLEGEILKKQGVIENLNIILRQEYDKDKIALEKQIDLLKTEKTKYLLDNKHIVDTEIEKIKQAHDKLIRSKETELKNLNIEKEKRIIQIDTENRKHLNLLTEANKKLYEELQKQRDIQQKIYDLHLQQIQNQNQNQSTSHKGKEGENIFVKYANEAFGMIDEYKVIDTSSKGNSGDSHIHFKTFNMLADAKNYTNNVPITQIEKIKRDLGKNKHVTFGWLVSLNSDISNHNQAPITCEWINTEQCIIYINNLHQFDDPVRIIKLAKLLCDELYTFIKFKSQTANNELLLLKDEHYKIRTKINDIRKTIKELNTHIKNMKTTTDTIDNNLKEILDMETKRLVESNLTIIDQWWNLNIIASNTKKLTIDEIYSKFNMDNDKFEITPDILKKYIENKFDIVVDVDIKKVTWKTSIKKVVKKVATKVAKKVDAE